MEAVSEAVVYIVDDDDAGRGSLRYLLESIGLRVAPYANPSEFLEQFDDDALGCVVLDMRLPKIGGLEVLRTLRDRGTKIPVIMITAFGDVRVAVEAMKYGAYDFFEKPFNDQELLDCIQQCVQDHTSIREIETQRAEIRTRLDRLTVRERQVLDHIIEGKQNKQIAVEMDISTKTVEAYRSKLMEKMQARSVAQLVQSISSLE